MLMSLFSRLFKKQVVELPSIEHKGFSITPVAKSADGQYHTSGVIQRFKDGEQQEAFFIRADRHPTFEQAQEHTFLKGKQIIDEQGERLFENERI